MGFLSKLIMRVFGQIPREPVAFVAFFFALTGSAVAANNYIKTTDPIPAASDLAGTYGNPLIAGSKVQARVNGTCASGSAIATINQDGTVGCESIPPGANPPSVFSFVAATGFTAIGDGTWHDMPNVALTFTLNAAAPVQLAGGFSTLIGGSYLITRVVADTVPVPGSQRVIGNVAYGSTSAVNFLVLNAGTHTVTMQYQTAVAFTFDPATFDWQTASLQVLAFDQ